MKIEIRKVIINIFLLTAAVFIAIVIVTPLIAEIEFNVAQKFAAKYQWQRAEYVFEEVVKIAPFNSEYFAELGKFILEGSKYSNGKAKLLDETEGLYQRAIRLNPGDADYWMSLGRIKLEKSFLLGKIIEDKKLTDAFDCFRKALENDPNGFNINYSIGYTGISAWEYLGEKDKEFILERLRYALKCKIKYTQYIYTKLWKYTKDFYLLQKITPDTLQAQAILYDFIITNSLWQFRNAQAEVVLNCRRREDTSRVTQELATERIKIKKIKYLISHKAKEYVTASDWQDMARDGKNTHENGNMYWAGTIYSVIDIPEGASKISVQAKGEPADGIWPYMIVELDGEIIGETIVDNSEWKDFSFRIHSDGDIKVLSITFMNDYCTETEDRNLYIGEARVE